MPDKLIFTPVLVQVMLTLYIYIRISIAKTAAYKAGLVNPSRRALYDDAWPENVIQLNNNLRNQFELPVLFYLLVLVLWLLNAIDIFAHITAWLFVTSRFVHAYVHTGTNYVPLRRRVFIYGTLMVMVLVILTLKALVL